MISPLIRHFRKGIFVAGLCAFAAMPACAKTVTPFFGMQIQGLSPTIVETLGLDIAGGVMVRDIAYPGPASHSGVRRGDIIIKLNDQDATDVDSVVKMVQGFQPNSQVKATILRRGRTMNVMIPIGSLPSEWNIQRNKFATIAPLGISFAALTQKVKERFNIAWRSRGVVVSLVDEEKAAGLDIRVGDVVVQVNQTPVWNPTHIISNIKKAQTEKREMVLLLVEGANGFRFVLLPVPIIGAGETNLKTPLPTLAPDN
ncbi:PDZ domain-containing protein [Terasakiella sp. SH-1]|uniref:PDZ domain-containing protein n=1 Tax=Terasakiella sp. SH-1 TaxID=2560057 RepID=UPI0010743C9D|nr:PDZ domain-containing protein [Terasakiella sp. SH-1]